MDVDHAKSNYSCTYWSNIDEGYQENKAGLLDHKEHEAK